MLVKKKSFWIKIDECARCGGYHRVKAKMFKERPIGKSEYWAMCPYYKEPVLVRV